MKSKLYKYSVKELNLSKNSKYKKGNIHPVTLIVILLIIIIIILYIQGKL